MQDPTPGNRVAGAALFLAVTACWLVGLAAWEQSWIDPPLVVLPVAAVLSVPTVVATGYLGGRAIDAFWLGWIPGAAMMAIGFAMVPEPGGDEIGATMVFFGGLVLAFGWPLVFFPLIAVGAELRRRRASLPTTDP
jgi:hypothetical protein